MDVEKQDTTAEETENHSRNRHGKFPLFYCCFRQAGAATNGHPQPRPLLCFILIENGRSCACPCIQRLESSAGFSYRLPMCVEGEIGLSYQATNIALHHFYLRMMYPWHIYLFCLLHSKQCNDFVSFVVVAAVQAAGIMTRPSLFYCHICDESPAHIYASTYCDHRKCQTASDRSRVGSKVSTCITAAKQQHTTTMGTPQPTIKQSNQAIHSSIKVIILFSALVCQYVRQCI